MKTRSVSIQLSVSFISSIIYPIYQSPIRIIICDTVQCTPVSPSLKYFPDIVIAIEIHSDQYIGILNLTII